MAKSMSLTCGVEPLSSASTTFSSERSLWATPRLCNHLTAERTCAATGAMMPSRSAPGAGLVVHQEKRSPCVARVVTAYVCSPSRSTSRSSHAQGYLRLFSSIRIPRSSQGRSQASAYVCSNSAGLALIHALGMRLTTTLRPSRESSILSMHPKFWGDACRRSTKVKRPASQRPTLEANSFMEAFKPASSMPCVGGASPGLASCTSAPLPRSETKTFCIASGPAWLLRANSS
mmetsp:Transcript_60394/g.189168  ORF Transcript_60394/g.189168 Transcript_60394/m.189168 type:complete len:232 (+) Transcript_60394:136-831(+)